MDFRKLIFESKIPNRNPISGFEVPILYFFEAVRCRFRIFLETEFSPNPNSKFWQSRCLHFHPISTQNFAFCRVYIQNFPSHLAKYPKYFSNFSSTSKFNTVKPTQMSMNMMYLKRNFGNFERRKIDFRTKF